MPRITSLLIKPVSAVCNLDCEYCFYLDRGADPYKAVPARQMSLDTLGHVVDTYLFYSWPGSVFAFQGGEPTLAGLPFFEKVIEYQQRYGRSGQTVSNSLQTNGMLLDQHWCDLFLAYNWLVGVSLDGPESVNDLYRFNKEGRGTSKRVRQSIELLQKNNVEFNVLCVLSRNNVQRPKELYHFFRSIGVDNLQFIPLAEFDGLGNPLPFTISPAQYGHFLCETFDLWWPDRCGVRIRLFDNIAEAVAGQKPSTCTMHESCDSYVVVEYNGDVYPCDFFVEERWKIGNTFVDSWPEIARQSCGRSFAATKSLRRAECEVCDYRSICHGGCPKFRHGPNGHFDDLDYFCEAYKMIYERSIGPLRAELRQREDIVPRNDVESS